MAALWYCRPLDTNPSNRPRPSLTKSKKILQPCDYAHRPLKFNIKHLTLYCIIFVFACLALNTFVTPLLVLLNKLIFQKGDRAAKSNGLLHIIDFDCLIMFCGFFTGLVSRNFDLMPLLRSFKRTPRRSQSG